MENLFEESINKELRSMDQRLYDLEEKMNSIDTKLSQVVDAILGNPLTKTGGFINDIDILENKIEKLEIKMAKQEDFKKKFYWAVGIISFLLIIGQYISSIYSNIKR